MPSPPLRLAYLVSRYPAVNHTYILREVQALRRLGVEVEVISISGPDRPIEDLDPAERSEAEHTYYVKSAGWPRIVADHLLALSTRPLACLRGIGRALRLARFSPGLWLQWLLFFGEAVVVARRMRWRGIHHMHTHYASSVALLAVELSPLTMSMTIHGPAEFEEPRTFALGAKIGRSRFVIAISQYARSQLMRHSPWQEWNKFEVCRLGVDPDKYTPGAEDARTGPFRLLMVGQLSPAKGIPIAIEAVARLARHNRDVILRIVGDGPLRPILADSIATRNLQSRIVLEGSLNHEAVIPLYRQSDAFLMPSFAEGLPVVLMEAMAAGLPCVATRITGIPELIDDGADGLLVAPSDVDGLTEAIMRLMDDPGLRGRLAEAARRRVEQDYDISRNAEALAKIFLRRLGGTLQ